MYSKEHLLIQLQTSTLFLCKEKNVQMFSLMHTVSAIVKKSECLCSCSSLDWGESFLPDWSFPPEGGGSFLPDWSFPLDGGGSEKSPSGLVLPTIREGGLPPAYPGASWEMDLSSPREQIDWKHYLPSYCVRDRLELRNDGTSRMVARALFCRC